MKRRNFIQWGAGIGLGSLVMSAKSVFPRRLSINPPDPIKPVVVSSENGIDAVKLAYDRITAGADALTAVIAGVNLVEDDPNDHSVGLGGLPNEDGIVELDACCMHGPTHNAGAVAALQNIRNPSSVARLVMERTDHILLVGAGALRFAKRHGFAEENLLTDEARKIWLDWKENMSKDDDWLPRDPKSEKHSHLPRQRLTGTINCNAIDLQGNISGVTTTSGLSYKIPGRVGDSPIIGAGLYVDNDIGACGSTGRGEENLKNLSSFMVIEYMRTGMTPAEACVAVCRRIVEKARLQPLLMNKDGKPNFNVKFYAIHKNGDFSSAGIFGPYQYSVCDDRGNRHEAGLYLYKSP